MFYIAISVSLNNRRSVRVLLSSSTLEVDNIEPPEAEKIATKWMIFGRTFSDDQHFIRPHYCRVDDRFTTLQFAILTT